MLSDRRPVDPALLDQALKVLRKRFSNDCIIASAECLSNPERRNVIARIWLHSPSGDAPSSVILKQSLPVKSVLINDAKIEEENIRTFERFSRDWAGLAFVTSLNQDTHNVPSFYAASHEHRFILIEDLGDPHVSLVDSLIAPNRENAVYALERYVKALGSFHAASYERTHEYERILHNINPAAQKNQTELQNISEDLPRRISEVFAQKQLGISISDECKLEMRQVLEGIFNPGSFTVLTHGDIAPDNVFDHKDGRGLQLIDFENCAVRNALLDGTYLRMSIPTGWCAKAIPEDIIRRCEQIYRDELCKSIPAASNDKQYNLAYTQACAFHVLMQLTAVNSCLDKNEVWKGPVIKDSLWNAETNFLRPRFLSRLQAFIDVASRNELFPELTKMSIETLNKLKSLWPESHSLDMYPAFNPALSNQNAVASTYDIDKRIGVKKEASKLDLSAEPLQKTYGKSNEAEQHQEDRDLANVSNKAGSSRSKQTPFPTTPIPPWEKGK